MPASQAGCRGFDPRLPLHLFPTYGLGCRRIPSLNFDSSAWIVIWPPSAGRTSIHRLYTERKADADRGPAFDRTLQFHALILTVKSFKPLACSS
jgi:hypothetical protein